MEWLQWLLDSVKAHPRGHFDLSRFAPIVEVEADRSDSLEQIGFYTPEEHAAAALQNTRLRVSLWTNGESPFWDEPDAVERVREAVRGLALGELSREAFTARLGEPLPAGFMIIRDGERVF